MRAGAGSRNERRVGGRGDLRHLTQQLHITGGVIEMIVADQRAIRLAAELAVLRFVQRLEERTLVPGRAFVLLQAASELRLRDVHHLDPEHLVRLGVAHEIVQAAPRALDLLETRVVKDHVELIASACWSISATMALIVPTTSSATTAVSRSACSASVRTARSTSSRARSVFGLNSLRSKSWKLIGLRDRDRLGGLDIQLTGAAPCGLFLYFGFPGGVVVRRA